MAHLYVRPVSSTTLGVALCVRTHTQVKIFIWKFEKIRRKVVSWFRLGFRFAFRWPFRVSSSTERAVRRHLTPLSTRSWRMRATLLPLARKAANSDESSWDSWDLFVTYESDSLFPLARKAANSDEFSWDSWDLFVTCHDLTCKSDSLDSLFTRAPLGRDSRKRLSWLAVDSLSHLFVTQERNSLVSLLTRSCLALHSLVTQGSDFLDSLFTHCPLVRDSIERLSWLAVDSLCTCSWLKRVTLFTRSWLALHSRSTRSWLKRAPFLTRCWLTVHLFVTQESDSLHSLFTHCPLARDLWHRLSSLSRLTRS